MLQIDHFFRHYSLFIVLVIKNRDRFPNSKEVLLNFEIFLFLFFGDGAAADEAYGSAEATADHNLGLFTLFEGA
jgi:hypothetical protein